jgi:monovalent cation/hydrogen antiporter
MASLVETLVGLLIVVVALVSLAQRLGQPYPIVLVLGGFGLAFIPGLPRLVLDPDLVLLLFLPPLVFSTAWLTSWRDFRAQLRSISLLAIGLVIATTLLIGIAGHLLGLSWAAAFLLGAIVSPTDTVAAAALSERLRLPRRIVTVVEGESMVNDATGLIVYRFAIAAALSGAFSLAPAVGQFLLSSVLGILLGLVVGVLGVWLFRRIQSPATGITLSFLLPYAAYLPASSMQASGVLAVVTAGIFIGQREATLLSPESRLQANGVWEFVVFLLNSILFILLGFQVHTILALSPRATIMQLIGEGMLLGLLVMLIRMAWVFPGSWLAWRLGVWSRQPRVERPDLRQVVVVGWLGMRGVVSLAAALALPVGLVAREPVIFLTFEVVLVTLLVEGLGLPFVVNRLGITDDGDHGQQHQRASRAMIQAGLDHLTTLEIDQDGPNIIAFMRKRLTKQLSLLDGQEPPMPSGVESVSKLRLDLIAVQRTAMVQLRDVGEISDEVLHEMERDLDYEEVRIRNEAHVRTGADDYG